MSDQSLHNEAKRTKIDRHKFIVYAALAVALSAGFGYSMASIRHQEIMAQMSANSQAELNKAHALSQAAKDRIHRRYMRQINQMNKERIALDAELIAILKERGKE